MILFTLSFNSFVFRTVNSSYHEKCLDSCRILRKADLYVTLLQFSEALFIILKADAHLPFKEVA